MSELKKRVSELLAQSRQDKFRKYNEDWQAEAISLLNEYYIENGREDEEIYDLNSDIFEDIVKYNLENRGWLGVKCFLDGIDNSANYAYIDAYGNARSCDYDLEEKLEEVEEEL